MVTKKDHHWSQCLAFPDYWGKVKEVKIEKLKLQYRENERVRLITTRFEQKTSYNLTHMCTFVRVTSY